MPTITEVQGNLPEHPSFKQLLAAGFRRDDPPSEPCEQFRKPDRFDYAWPSGWSQVVTGEIGYRDHWGGFWTK